MDFGVHIFLGKGGFTVSYYKGGLFSRSEPLYLSPGPQKRYKDFSEKSGSDVVFCHSSWSFGNCIKMAV
jgi:hypothetical protein